MTEWKEWLRAARRKKRAWRIAASNMLYAQQNAHSLEINFLPSEHSRSLPFLRQISKYNRDFVYLGENVFSIANPLE